MERRRREDAPRPEALAALLATAVDWLSGLDLERARLLAERSEVLTLQPGDLLCRTGAAPAAVHVVLAGRLAVTRPGAPRTAGPEPGGYGLDPTPGTTLGLANVMSGRRWEHDVRAVTPARVAALPSADVVGLARADGAVGVAVARHLAGLLQDRTELLADLVLLDVSRRVAAHLLRRADGAGEGSVVVASQGELALQVSASRQRVNAALADLTRRGWVRNDGSGRFTLCDPDALARFAGLAAPEPR